MSGWKSTDRARMGICRAYTRVWILYPDRQLIYTTLTCLTLFFADRYRKGPPFVVLKPQHIISIYQEFSRRQRIYSVHAQNPTCCRACPCHQIITELLGLHSAKRPRIPRTGLPKEGVVGQLLGLAGTIIYCWHSLESCILRERSRLSISRASI